MDAQSCSHLHCSHVHTSISVANCICDPFPDDPLAPAMHLYLWDANSPNLYKITPGSRSVREIAHGAAVPAAGGNMIIIHKQPAALRGLTARCLLGRGVL